MKYLEDTKRAEKMSPQGLILLLFCSVQLSAAQGTNMADLNAVLAQVLKQNNDLQKEFKQGKKYLEKQLAILQEKVKNLKEENTQLKKDVTILIKENINQKSQHKNVNKDIAELKKVNIKTSKDNTQLKNDVNYLRTELINTRRRRFGSFEPEWRQTAAKFRRQKRQAIYTL